MKRCTVYIKVREIRAGRGRRNIGAIDREAGVENRLRVRLAREVTMHIPRAVLKSSRRRRGRYFILVILDQTVAAPAVEEPIRGSVRIRSGNVNRAVVIGKIFDENNVRAQTRGGQTGNSKGEEMFLHRQFWICA